MDVFGKRSGCSVLAAALSLLLLGPLVGESGGTVLAAAADPFPEIRPTTRVEAIKLLREKSGAAFSCLTPGIQLSRENGPFGETPAVRRSVALLERRISFAREEAAWGPGGILVRYTTVANAFDRIDPADADGDGIPDVLSATIKGLEEASGLLLEGLALSAPLPTEVLLVELGDGLDGYTVPARGQTPRSRLVLDASPRQGVDGARRAAIHQFAHAVAQAVSPSFPHDWAEAFATWSVLSLDGKPESFMLETLSNRLRNLDSGLLDTQADLGAGNALWLAFLEQAYGPAAVRATIDELGRGLPVASALDRAVRQVSSDDLASAFAEFHLWSLLVGTRADGRHFSFAESLPNPVFSAIAEGLPALSVRAEPPVSAFGAAQIRLLPDSGQGGMHIHFEGDLSARWETDLILISDQGAIRRRLPLELSGEGRGGSTIPLEGIEEAWLLIRNIGGYDEAVHRYTYSADLEQGFPFELSMLEAAPLDEPGMGVLVSWETQSEQQLIGFNILRQREQGGRQVVVNPVWIPAVGDQATLTSYHFIDRSAEPAVAYIYHIEGITSSGLSSRSRPVVAGRADLRR
jgi:hypothetical protein